MQKLLLVFVVMRARVRVRVRANPNPNPNPHPNQVTFKPTTERLFTVKIPIKIKDNPNSGVKGATTLSVKGIGKTLQARARVRLRLRIRIRVS